MYSRNLGKIIVIIPAFNEESRIANVVMDSMTYLPVLVIDDGSTDETVQVSRSSGAEILLQVPNQGKGAALKAGFQRALDEGVEAVITLDADGQHDPNEIPNFLNAYNAKPTDYRDEGFQPNASCQAAGKHAGHIFVLLGSWSEYPR